MGLWIKDALLFLALVAFWGLLLGDFTSALNRPPVALGEVIEVLAGFAIWSCFITIILVIRRGWRRMSSRCRN
jgi:hypothetical protein